MTTQSRPLLTCSTGVITRWPDATDPERLIRYCPQIDADRFEVMIYDAWYDRLDPIVSGICALERPIVAVHAEKSIGPNLIADDRTMREKAFHDLRINCRFAKDIGAKLVVLHLWGLPDGDTKIDQQLQTLPELIDIARDADVDLGIETIPCTISTPLQYLARVVERDPRVRIVLDTEFLAMHDELDDALDANWLWGDSRVVHVHVKDYDGKLVDSAGRRRYLHPGDGNIDFTQWFGRLANRGFNGTIALEAPVVGSDGAVDLLRLNTSLGCVRDMIEDAWSPCG